ncbi:hypothetical protein QQP08_007543 [Theobroma cacao]|nr:hypothetical protein QQP08_007543 [Theobroma cacao]
MAWRSAGSLSRTVMSAARAPSLRTPPPLPRLRPPTSSAPRLQSRRPSLAPSRNFGELGCVQSFLPLHSMVATARLTSHLTVNVRACCELYLKGPWISAAECNTQLRESEISFVLWESRGFKLMNPSFLDHPHKSAGSLL